MPRTAVIYHVIGTLEWRHIQMSLESLQANVFTDADFILYNGGDFPDDKILGELRPSFVSMFQNVKVCEYLPGTPKGALADWDEQMRRIDGYERYLCHKADFYIPAWIGELLDVWDPGHPLAWLLLFSKFSMKEKAGDAWVREYARSHWEANVARPSTKTYLDHVGGLAVSWDARTMMADGTMHAYNDAARAWYTLDPEERESKWGVAMPLRRMDAQGIIKADERFFAVHQYHATPDRTDPVVNVEGERF